MLTLNPTEKVAMRKAGRRSVKVQVCCALTLFGLISSQAQTYDRSRYTLILDREPFGSEPVVPQDLPPSKEQQAAEVNDQLRLCMVVEEENGEKRAGLERKKHMAGKGIAKSFVLSIGQSEQDVKLVDVDVAAGQATIMNRGQRIVLAIEKGATPAAAPPTIAPRASMPIRRVNTGARSQAVNAAPPKEPPRQPTPEEREQIRKNLQEYQMEVIRKGMPPLPIPLTEEMDNQLVAEGVLPPTE
jgi:hypothetical protein